MLLDTWAANLPSGQDKPAVYTLLQVLFPLESQSSLSHSCKYPTPFSELRWCSNTSWAQGWPRPGCLLQLGLEDRSWATHSRSWYYPTHLQRYSPWDSNSFYWMYRADNFFLIKFLAKMKTKNKFKKCPTNWTNVAWEGMLQTGQFPANLIFVVRLVCILSGIILKNLKITSKEK